MFCDNHYLAIGIYAAVILATVLGLFLAGWLGDNFGRLKTLRYILMSSVLGQFLILFAATPVYYAIVNAFVALSLAPLVMLPLVWLCEMTDNSSRGLFMSCAVFCFILGEVFVSFCKMFVGSWRHLVAIDIGIGVTALLLTYTLPESFRYFAGVKRRFIKARTILNRIAEANGRETFDEKLQGEEQNEYNATGGLNEADSRSMSPNSHKISSDAVVNPPGEYSGTLKTKLRENKNSLTWSRLKYQTSVLSALLGPVYSSPSACRPVSASFPPLQYCIRQQTRSSTQAQAS
jgi:MFS family permease